ncbi:MAG: YtxH domain-containing protein [Sphingobacteriia bacterium]|jgi:gas vesicle protein
MNENHKFTAGLLLGALAGTALALYLNSEKGKQLLSDIQLDAATLKSEIDTGIDKVDESLQEMLLKARKLVTELEQKLGDTQIT